MTSLFRFQHLICISLSHREPKYVSYMLLMLNVRAEEGSRVIISYLVFKCAHHLGLDGSALFCPPTTKQ